MRHSWRERTSYHFDNLMARGAGALIVGLGMLSLFFILLMAAVISLGQIGPGDNERMEFWEAAWQSLMRTLDAGTMGSDEGWIFRLTMFAVTLGGVFIISSLIGVVTSGIENKMTDLRKGRSRVIERGHTVILGWSPQVFTVLSELVIANANQPHSCIVILGNKDKVEMEDEICAAINHPGHTRIVCRTGSPMDPNDLRMVSLQTSRSIIILSPDSPEPDAETIKTILAITNSPNRRTAHYHIVAEIADPKNYEIANMVGKDEVALVLSGDLIARLIAQTCRQSGLSVIYSELMDFGGDEIYFKDEPTLTGKTFHQALLAYEDSAVIGLRTAHGVLLNPPPDTVLGSNDLLIAISEDDDTIRLRPESPAPVEESKITHQPPTPPKPEHTLILGWNANAPAVINELDQYASPGSSITIVATDPSVPEKLKRLCAGLVNEQAQFHPGDTTDRRILDELRPQAFDHVIVLAYSDALEMQEADARTLMTLLHLRDIAEKSGTEFPIVSEMLDMQNRSLAEVTRADDFIVSDRIVSLILTQVSENKDINAIFTNLFDPEGAEVYLKPAGQYVCLEEPVNFYTVVEAAARRDEVAFGYRIKAWSKDPERRYGIVINPDKSNTIILSQADKIIVMSEN
jgi:ion channel POLLUX/CASTOR